MSNKNIFNIRIVYPALIHTLSIINAAMNNYDIMKVVLYFYYHYVRIIALILIYQKPRMSHAQGNNLLYTIVYYYNNVRYMRLHQMSGHEITILSLILVVRWLLPKAKQLARPVRPGLWGANYGCNWD